MSRYLILNDDNIVENIIVGPLNSPNCVPCPNYQVFIGYKFNDELQVFLHPDMTVEEFNSMRNDYIERLNEIESWYTLYLTSSHYSGLSDERKIEIQTWAVETFSTISTETEKLTTDNSYVLSYSVPFSEILEFRPNIEAEV